MSKCPDSECHERLVKTESSVKEARDDITGLKNNVYGEGGKGGIIGTGGLKDCLNKKQDKLTVRYYLGSSIAILLASIGFVATMWAQTQQVPENKENIGRVQSEMSDVKRDVAVLQNSDEKRDREVQEMKSKIDKMYDIIVLGKTP